MCVRVYGMHAVPCFYKVVAIGIRHPVQAALESVACVTQDCWLHLFALNLKKLKFNLKKLKLNLKKDEVQFEITEFQFEKDKTQIEKDKVGFEIIEIQFEKDKTQFETPLGR